MASPQPEDIRMRADLAVAAIEEVTIRVEQVVEESGQPGKHGSETLDVYRLLGRLAEAVGHIAMGLKLVEPKSSKTVHGEVDRDIEEEGVPAPFQGRRPSPGLDDR